MLSNPRPGQPVLIWYNPDIARHAPLHAQSGRVLARARRPRKGELPVRPLPVGCKRDKRGRPIPPSAPLNHIVAVDGAWHVVPAGNLRSLQP